VCHTGYVSEECKEGSSNDSECKIGGGLIALAILCPLILCSLVLFLVKARSQLIPAALLVKGKIVELSKFEKVLPSSQPPSSPASSSKEAVDLVYCNSAPAATIFN
jgi:hypothetical protein